MIDPCELTPAYIRAIAPYQPGKPISELSREMGLPEASIIKLASNENPMGPSPKALEALTQGLDELSRYPDGSAFVLRAALAAHHRLGENQVVLGNGSNDVLDLAARAFLAPSTSAVYSQHAFIVYPLATQTVGARGISVPARDYGHDLPAMAAAVQADTRVLWIANPNNPTGTFVGADALRTLLEAVPRRVLVVLDEAYGEYLEPAERLDSLAWLGEYPNLVLTRTFSKAYGLAGLRVGYALAHPEVADLLNRVRQPFNVGSLAQQAAVAALADEAFVARSRALNAQGMKLLTEAFAVLGLDYIPSRGNFVTFRAGAAQQVYQSLLQRGIIVRPIGGYGMPEHLRVSIGLPQENERFLVALRDCLQA